MISQAKNLGLAQARGTPTRTGLKKEKKIIWGYIAQIQVTISPI